MDLLRKHKQPLKSSWFLLCLSLGILFSCSEKGEKKLIQDQKDAIVTLNKGISPISNDFNETDYLSAIQGDKSKAKSFAKTILTKRKFEIRMSDADADTFLSAPNTGNNALAFGLSVGIFLFRKHPATSTHLAPDDNTASLWIRQAFTPSREGLTSGSFAHRQALERIFGTNRGLKNDGAIHTHDYRANSIPQSMFLFLTDMLVSLGIVDTLGIVARPTVAD